MMQLWEILVPCQYNDGKPVRTRHHREWDKVVRKITGGLTIFKPVKGQWVHEGQLYAERMIPVRIACSEKDIRKIAKFSLGHYKQLAVFVSLVSEKVLIINADNQHSIAE